MEWTAQDRQWWSHHLWWCSRNDCTWYLDCYGLVDMVVTGQRLDTTILEVFSNSNEFCDSASKLLISWKITEKTIVHTSPLINSSKSAEEEYFCMHPFEVQFAWKICRKYVFLLKWELYINFYTLLLVILVSEIKFSYQYY